MQWHNYHPQVCTAHLNSWQTLLQEWTVDQHWHTNTTYLKANCWACWYSLVETIAAINVHKKMYITVCHIQPIYCRKNTCFQALEWSPWTHSHFIIFCQWLFTFFFCTVMSWHHHHITRSTSRGTCMLLYFYPALKKYTWTVTPYTW